MQKLLIVLLVLVIAFMVVFVFGNKDAGEETQSPSPTPAITSTPVTTQEGDSNGGEDTTQDLPQTRVIEIFDDGFRPSSLTISVGDTVQFVNEGTRNHWPASGVHPTHNICKGFDALRELQPGESYEHTFNEAKTCPMHDHLNLSITGSIVVEPR